MCKSYREPLTVVSGAGDSGQEISVVGVGPETVLDLVLTAKIPASSVTEGVQASVDRSCAP